MLHIKMPLFIFGLTIFLSSCGIQTPAPSIEEAYPGYPGQSISTTQTMGVSLPIPTPKDNLGVVVGKLLTPNVNGTPYLSTIYLARTLQADYKDFSPMLAFSEKSLI